MLRHSVLWIMREPLSESARLRMLQRLSYLGTEPPSVSSGDYGADLFGGSEILHKVRPSERVPTWRRGVEGPACNYDMALHLDFADWGAFQEYAVDDPAHAQASDANEADNWDELTARCDFHYDRDAPPTHAGEVKHVAMFLWADGAADDAKAAAREGIEGLAEADEVESVLIGDNVGESTTAFDWIMDLRISDRDAAARLLAGPAYREAMTAVAAATMFEWTARMSHVMHRP